jgi:molybdenum cofactor biosynthesis enzyme MoaA
MKYLLIASLFLNISAVSAQQVVFDAKHFTAVTQNAAMRSSAETTHANYLNKINTSIDNLNTNVGAVVIAQTMIYQGLSNVNSALKNGLAVRNMAIIIADMTGYIDQAVRMARDEPYLLVFANSMAAEMRTRSLALVGDVFGFVLKEGDNVLADYNARDQLLRRITQQLQLLDSLAYGAWKAMYWAKQRGMIASVNPYAGFINQDRSYVEQIIRNAKYLKP